MFLKHLECFLYYVKVELLIIKKEQSDVFLELHFWDVIESLID